jgi:hypothetical protein
VQLVCVPEFCFCALATERGTYITTAMAGPMGAAIHKTNGVVRRLEPAMQTTDPVIIEDQVGLTAASNGERELDGDLLAGAEAGQDLEH